MKTFLSRQPSSRVFYSLSGIIAVILSVTVLLVLFFPSDEGVTSGTDVGSIWHYEDGSRADLMHIEAPMVIYADLTLVRNSSRDLCFRGRNIEFDVYEDGELIYSYHPVNQRILGKSYGTDFHSIGLSFSGNTAGLRIEVSPTDSSVNGIMSEVRLMDGSQYIKRIYSDNKLNITLSYIMVALGLVLYLGGLAIFRSKEYSKEITSMGLFTIVASVWASTETGYWQLCGADPAAVHVLSYISLILLPGAGISFLGYITGCYRSIIVRVMPVIAICTCALDILLTAGGVCDYHYLLPLTHVQLIVAVIAAFYYSFRAMSARKGRKITFFIIPAFVIAATGGIIDIFRFYRGMSGTDSAYFFRLGLMVFVAVLSMAELYQLTSFRLYEAEAVTMRNLAHTDQLTGLGNRMGYSEFEKSVAKDKGGHYLIMLLDINYLKKVNDTLGHEHGDRHICAAARIIRDSFDDGAMIFRTGGDEFIVVLRGTDAGERYKESTERMNRAVGKYNNHRKDPVALEIAYGMAEFDSGEKTAEEALRRADHNMYQMKKHMKVDPN